VTNSYYIKVRLDKKDAEHFQEMSVAPQSAAGVIDAMARRWIQEIRPRCETEVQSRAIIFRTIVEAGREGGMPEKLAIAWAHLLTDRIAERVVQIAKSAATSSPTGNL